MKPYGSRALQVSSIINIVAAGLAILLSIPMLLVAAVGSTIDWQAEFSNVAEVEEFAQMYPFFDIDADFMVHFMQDMIMPLLGWIFGIMLVSAILMLISGIVGVRRWNDPWRSRPCVGWGVAQIVLSVLECVLLTVLMTVWVWQLYRMLNISLGETEGSTTMMICTGLSSTASSLILPVAYLVGAIQNRRTAARWADEGWQPGQFPPPEPEWQPPQYQLPRRPAYGRYDPQTGVWQSGRFDPMTGEFRPDDPMSDAFRPNEPTKGPDIEP